jgi:hypothetical protein
MRMSYRLALGRILLIALVLAGTPWPASAESAQQASSDAPTRLSASATARGDGVKAAIESAITDALRGLVEQQVDAVLLTDKQLVERSLRELRNSPDLLVERNGTPQVIGDMVEVTVTVTIDRDTVLGKFSRTSKPRRFAVDGQELTSQIELAQRDRQAKKDLIESVFALLPESLIDLTLIDADGRPISGLDPRLAAPIGDGSQTQLNLLIRVSFDESAWNNEVKPALIRVLDAVAIRSFKDGLVLDKKSESSGQTNYGIPTSPVFAVSQQGLRTAAAGVNLVGVQVEEWVKDRRLIYKVYEIEAGIDRSFSKPRLLKIRLQDDAGRTVQGGEFRIAGSISLGQPQQFATSFDGVSGGTVVAWSYSEKNIGGDLGLALPRAQLQGQAGPRDGQSFTLIGPRFLFKPALDWTLVASRIWVIGVPFVLPTEDLGIIESVSLEIMPDPTPQPKSAWEDPSQLVPLDDR